MADMPSDFWSGWIAVLTTVGLLGLTWIVFSVYFSGKGEPHEKSPVWDGTLSEGAHPPPLWWFWMIVSALVCTVAFLILYPGYGSFAGTMRWSMGSHMEHSDGMYAAEFGNLRAKIAATPLETLQTDPIAMASAERIFKQNCAPCHGARAQGQAALFPNLRDNDWQWGGDAKQIEETIREGRQATMPPHRETIGDAGVVQMVRYVTTLSHGGDLSGTAEGQAIFNRVCFACHGRDAKGNNAVGAPNLTDIIWLYGGGPDALAETIANGRNGTMPSFDERLDDTQIRLLVAWLLRK